MNDAIKVTKADKTVKRIVEAAFPEYKGRKIKVEVATRPLDVADYWDGGSRSYFVFLNIQTLAKMPVPSQGMNDRKVAGANAVTLPPGFVCVEHSIFCGKDCGIRIYVNPADMPKAIQGVDYKSDAPRLGA